MYTRPAYFLKLYSSKQQARDPKRTKAPAKMTKLVSLIFSLIFFCLAISLVRSEDAVSVSGTDAAETSAQLSPSILLESVVKGDIEGVDQ